MFDKNHMYAFLQSSALSEVVLLVLPEASLMCVASVIEPMRAANRVSGKQLFKWQVTSLSGSAIETTCGLPLVVDGQFAERSKGDLLVVIGGFNHGRHVDVSSISRLRKAASGFQTVVGIEAGTWILARAGLLNGRSATTHWEDFEAFTAAFPDVLVRRDRYVIDDNCITCGGASPAFDLFIELVQQKHGPSTAMEVAGVFVYDEPRSRSEFQPLVSLGHIAKRDRRLVRAVRLMEQHIEQPIPVAAIARRAGVSTGTLESIFKRHTGATPGRFYLDLRLKTANRLVLDTDLGLREIAIRSGFNSLSSFSRAYARCFGRPAIETRKGISAPSL